MAATKLITAFGWSLATVALLPLSCGEPRIGLYRNEPKADKEESVVGIIQFNDNFNHGEEVTIKSWDFKGQIPVILTGCSIEIEYDEGKIQLRAGDCKSISKIVIHADLDFSRLAIFALLHGLGWDDMLPLPRIS